MKFKVGDIIPVEDLKLFQVSDCVYERIKAITDIGSEQLKDFKLRGKQYGNEYDFSLSRTVEKIKDVEGVIFYQLGIQSYIHLCFDERTYSVFNKQIEEELDL